MNTNHHKGFDGEVIWVTGASSGIGEALTYALSQKGAFLVLSARSASKLEEVRQACAHPEHHMVLPLDLEDNATYDDHVARVIAKFGHVDRLFHVGGVSQFASLLETTPEVERKIMETNYFGVVSLTRSILPSMLDHGSGHLVVVSSLMGKFGPPFRTSYAASKHALHGYFDAMRAELWRRGIKVTLICPGFIKTQLSLNYLDGQGQKWGYMDKDHQRAMGPDACARKILKAVAKEKYEMNVGGMEIIGAYLKRFTPGLLTKILGRYKFGRDDMAKANEG